jgi:ElaB/YqjD/DUF883 family membrane-anchored ribosome-binding protein
MSTSTLAEQAVQTSSNALDSTQRAANQAVDSMGRVLNQSVERVREASHQVRDTAARASEGTVNYIRHDPVKSVLMAAATGAALMALVSLLTRSRDRS